MQNSMFPTSAIDKSGECGKKKTLQGRAHCNQDSP